MCKGEAEVSTDITEAEEIPGKEGLRLEGEETLEFKEANLLVEVAKEAAGVLLGWY